MPMYGHEGHPGGYRDLKAEVPWRQHNSFIPTSLREDRQLLEQGDSAEQKSQSNSKSHRWLYESVTESQHAILP
jgi:hypothetical protein